ncbi:MAG: class I SAM-dependent methyltransferase [Alphaproteobacteria bacterium]|nr:class I SAM-dependent methyltransferase [Alphaproteobacteria bacterium]
MSNRFWRRLHLGLKTLLTDSPKGYFIPYRYADGDIKPENRQPYGAVERVFEEKQPAFKEVMKDLLAWEQEFQGFNETKPPEPRWQQSWFPRLDAALAYHLVRKEKPRTIVEIGSGHSTRFMAAAIRDGNIKCDLISIDPAPRADISDLSSVQITECTIQNADLDVFKRLGAGDIVFVDSSHILMPGNDVDILFNHIIPLLPAGVLVHIHDMALPWDYPAAWQWRGYNEQLAVIPMICGGGYDVLWSSYYVANTMINDIPDWLVDTAPKPKEAMETSLWLRKVCPAVSQ